MGSDVSHIELPNTTFGGKLYLGSINSLLYVPKLNVDLVISLCDVSSITPALQRVLSQVQHVKYDIDDSTDAESAARMIYILQVTAPMIYKALSSGRNVLVHCYAGVSRSASVVINFVCQLYHIGFRDGFQLVSRNRSIVNPNFAFTQILYAMNSKTPQR